MPRLNMCLGPRLADWLLALAEQGETDCRDDKAERQVAGEEPALPPFGRASECRFPWGRWALEKLGSHKLSGLNEQNAGGGR